MSRKLAPIDHLVDNAVLERLSRVHDVVTIYIALELLERLPSRIGQNLIKQFPRAQNVTGLDINIRGLAAKA